MIEEFKKNTEQWYISEYLKYGSVEGVYRANRWDVLIPPASYHRLLKKNGIVKSSGRREASLSELLHFFAQKAIEPSIGIETLYHQMPLQFQTSLATLHRTYKRVVSQTTTRTATALIVHPESQKDKILLGQEIFTKRRLGKHRGDFTIPMCFSDMDEDPSTSILRVLQQETITNDAISQNIDLDLNLIPLYFFDILDVRVSIYEVYLPDKFSISSAKLDNLQFYFINEILTDYRIYRIGIREMLQKYLEIKNFGEIHISSLNLALLDVA